VRLKPRKYVKDKVEFKRVLITTNTTILPIATMRFDLEKTTPFSVSSEEVVALLQDAKKFMLAGGSTEEDSIRYDEDTGLWHGEIV